MGHIHELFDFTVSAYIVHPDRDKVLLIHHKKFNMWMQPGGHVELDEDPDQALLREVKEETGLDIIVLAHQNGPAEDSLKNLYTPNFFQVHEAGPGHKHIDLKYIALAKSPDIALAAAEHNDIRWFTREQLTDAELIPPAVAWYFYEALRVAEKDQKETFARFKKALQ